MGLNIRIHNIICPNNFTLSYRISPTPGNESVIATGYTQYGGSYVSSNSRNYNTDPIILSGSTFDNIFDQTVWIKIKDSVTQGYIIENIKIHELEYYDYCIHCCDFSGGTGSYIAGPTPTPTTSPTPTPSPTASSTPTPTPSPSPSSTAAPTATPTSTPGPTATETPTPTPSPTPTATGNGNCYAYQYGPAQAGCTIYWNDCQGVQQSTFVAVGQYYNIPCAQSGTLSGCGQFTQGALCNPTPTPTSTTAVDPTATPTPTPTPSPTPLPYSMSVYTGSTLSSACSNNGATTVYYGGVLGIGTILYAGSGYTNPIPPTVYCKFDDSTVYVIGLPSNEDGEITTITSCPTPTPTPTDVPTTFDVYLECGGLTYYYVDYSPSNVLHATINSACCERVDTNKDLTFIGTYYGSAIYQNSIINDNCECV